MMRLLVTFGHFPPWDFAPEKNVLDSCGALTTVPAPKGLGTLKGSVNKEKNMTRI